MTKYFYYDLETDEYQKFSSEEERNKSLLEYIQEIYFETRQWNFLSLDYGDLSHIIVATTTHEVIFKEEKIDIVEIS